jgi:hypothetical protein
LVWGSIGRCEHPEVNVAAAIGFATRDTSVKDDPDEAVETTSEFVDGGLHGLLELWLWYSEEGVVRHSKSLSVDPNESLIAFGRFNH